MRWGQARSKTARLSVSSRSSSSGARRTCASLSKAEFSLKSESASLPNSLNGMMSVTSLRWIDDLRSRDAERLLAQESEPGFAGST